MEEDPVWRNQDGCACSPLHAQGLPRKIRVKLTIAHADGFLNKRIVVYDMDTGAITTCDAESRCGEQETCVARPKDGEACTIDPDSGAGDCVTGFDCIGGKCTQLPPD